jgi:hypothetical protein
VPLVFGLSNFCSLLALSGTSLENVELIHSSILPPTS